MTTPRHASLYSVFAAKPLDGVSGAVLGCDLQSLSPAPFGNLVRVCFDRDYLCPDRDTAKQIGMTLLPIRKGFRHFVVEDGVGSFVVGLAPDDHGNEDVIFAKLHDFLPSHGLPAHPASEVSERPAEALA